MSLRLLRGSRSAALPLLAALVLMPAAGCRRDDTQKLAVVQGLSRDLGSARLLKQRAGCGYLTAAQQELFLCDGLLQTLLHFAPGFPGSRISVLRPSSGGLLSRQSTLAVHYEGRDGRGDLEVLLRREGKAWRIAAIIPSPSSGP